MRDLDIRRATDADLASVGAHYAPGGGDSPWDPFADLDRLRRIRRAGPLVARTDGAYAGFPYGYEGRKPWYAPEVDRFAEISDLHVPAAFPGRGIGRALLREALNQIAAAGLLAVFLENDEDNLGARRLYESEGFAAVAPGLVRSCRRTTDRAPLDPARTGAPGLRRRGRRDGGARGR